MSAKEYEGWLMYFNTKSPDIQEMQMAMLMHMVAQALGAKNSRVDDYILSNYKKEEKKQSTLFDSFASIATPYKPPSK